MPEDLSLAFGLVLAGDGAVDDRLLLLVQQRDEQYAEPATTEPLPWPTYCYRQAPAWATPPIAR